MYSKNGIDSTEIVSKSSARIKSAIDVSGNNVTEQVIQSTPDKRQILIDEALLPSPQKQIVYSAGKGKSSHCQSSLRENSFQDVSDISTDLLIQDALVKGKQLRIVSKRLSVKEISKFL